MFRSNNAKRVLTENEETVEPVRERSTNRNRYSGKPPKAEYSSSMISPHITRKGPSTKVAIQQAHTVGTHAKNIPITHVDLSSQKNLTLQFKNKFVETSTNSIAKHIKRISEVRAAAKKIRSSDLKEKVFSPGRNGQPGSSKIRPDSQISATEARMGIEANREPTIGQSTNFMKTYNLLNREKSSEKKKNAIASSLSKSPSRFQAVEAKRSGNSSLFQKYSTI
jgi:hypothetical protein